jgi:type III pantothenate kinase
LLLMNNLEKVILIDAGNTDIKICAADNGIIRSVKRFGYKDPELNVYLEQFREKRTVLSSVLDAKGTAYLIQKLSPYLILSSRTPIPVKLNYDTPETLGLDRVCNACAMYHHSKTTVSVAIDIGTCIKFDVLEGNDYIGGSISPGIELRYRSMNEFTGKLPLLNERGNTHLTGKSTKESIHSGVINGIQSELNGFMSSYRERYPELTFFITGGDAVHFDFEGKNDIFAIENLTLLGMYMIYSFNAK